MTMSKVQEFAIVKIRLSRAAVEHLAMSEEGRYEDYTRDLAEWNAGERYEADKPEPCLAYTCATEALTSHESSKYATICISSTDTAEDLYYAVCSGTFQIQFLTAARRIANVLRERVRVTNSPLVRAWPAPTGQ